jgi:hypothetical protein
MDTDAAGALPPGTYVFIQDKGISCCATVLSVPVDSSDMPEEYHYCIINLIARASRQVARDDITADRYTADNSAMKHNDTNSGIVSLPLLFRHTQKIMFEINGTYAGGYLKLMLNGTRAFVTLDK